MEDLDWPIGPEDTEAIGTGGTVHYLVFPRGGGRDAALPEVRTRRAPALHRPGRRARVPACVPSRLPASRRAHYRRASRGPCAAFTNEDAWTDEPFADGVVLVGDAAGWDDPIIGQGLSISMRDVRIVSELLLGTRDWSRPLFAPYAEERRARLRRLRFSAALNACLRAEFGVDASARRHRVTARIAEDGTLLLPLITAAFLGPETVPASFFEEGFRDRFLAS